MEASGTGSGNSSLSSSDNFDVWSDKGDITDSDIEDESHSDGSLAFEPVSLGSLSNKDLVCVELWKSIIIIIKRSERKSSTFN